MRTRIHRSTAAAEPERRDWLKTKTPPTGARTVHVLLVLRSDAREPTAVCLGCCERGRHCRHRRRRCHRRLCHLLHRHHRHRSLSSSSFVVRRSSAAGSYSRPLTRRYTLCTPRRSPVTRSLFVACVPSCPSRLCVPTAGTGSSRSFFIFSKTVLVAPPPK